MIIRSNTVFKKYERITRLKKEEEEEEGIRARYRYSKTLNTNIRKYRNDGSKPVSIIIAT